MNALEFQDKEVDILMLVDSDHSGEKYLADQKVVF